MNSTSLNHHQQLQVCELCKKHSNVKNYAEDFELQTALTDYLEQTSGEKVNIADISKLCDECFDKVRTHYPPEEEENNLATGIK